MIMTEEGIGIVQGYALTDDGPHMLSAAATFPSTSCEASIRPDTDRRRLRLRQFGVRFD